MEAGDKLTYMMEIMYHLFLHGRIIFHRLALAARTTEIAPPGANVFDALILLILTWSDFLAYVWRKSIELTLKARNDVWMHLRNVDALAWVIQ